MNLRHMEVFRAVMLTGSISGAAELLHVSQPAVSKALATSRTGKPDEAFAPGPEHARWG